MAHMHQYIPVVENTEEVSIPSLSESVCVPKAQCFPVFISGDQLTAARARGAKKAKINSDSPSSRLEGLVPATTDWHTKQALLGVSDYTTFFSPFLC